VDHLADDTVGNGPSGSLRYCITNAVDGDDIQFGVTGTINLTGALPDLAHSISIEGPGAGLLTVRRDTGGNYRIFTVDSGTNVTIAGLTITNGSLSYPESGGGIDNSGTLTVSNSTISGNHATLQGGGIYNEGTLTLSNSTVSGNAASIGSGISKGGGIYNSGTLTVSSSTIVDNWAISGDYDEPPPRDCYAVGGGIYNLGTLTISDGTIAYNVALARGYYFSYAEGGGIVNGLGSTLAVSNSTISYNATDASASDSNYAFSGGIANNGTLTVTNSTISGNSASAAGGFFDSYSWAWGGGVTTSDRGTLAVTNSTISGNFARAYPSRSFYCLGGGIAGSFRSQNTIIAGNSATTVPDISGNLGSLGHDLIGNTQGGSGFDPTDLLNVNPLLGPLQDNGGPTKTMALLPGSPAIDAGDNTGAPDWDQRGPGYPRIVAGTIDIGAFEVQIGAATHLAVSAPASVTAGTPFDVTVTALDAYGHIASGYTGTVTFSSSDTDPSVVLPAAYAFTANDQGTHIFVDGFTLITPGDQSLTATDSVSGITGSAIVTVNSPAPPPGVAAEPVEWILALFRAKERLFV
jgi:hypothetical protein